MMATGPWRTCLVVIARNEARHIDRLLRSVMPWVDDALILDTGSSDNTPALARAQGARVAHFDWCDDFAAARNCALAEASADWHIVLDGDEWLAEGGPAQASLRGLKPDHIGVVHLVDHGAAAGPVNSWLSRVFPANVRYRCSNCGD